MPKVNICTYGKNITKIISEEKCVERLEKQVSIFEKYSTKKSLHVKTNEACRACDELVR